MSFLDFTILVAGLRPAFNPLQKAEKDANSLLHRWWVRVTPRQHNSLCQQASCLLTALDHRHARNDLRRRSPPVLLHATTPFSQVPFTGGNIHRFRYIDSGLIVAHFGGTLGSVLPPTFDRVMGRHPFSLTYFCEPSLMDLDTSRIISHRHPAPVHVHCFRTLLIIFSPK
jgi:hypothetical protein